MSRRSSRKTNAQLPEAEPVTSTITSRKGRAEVKVEETEVVVKSPARSTKKRVKAEAGYQKDNIEDPEASAEIKISKVKTEAVIKEAKTSKPKKAPAKRKAKTEDDEEEDEDAGEKKVVKKRKTKEEKEAEAMPMASRTAVGALKKAIYIGAHVSAAGGVQNSIQNSLQIGGNAFSLFLKSQRKWTGPPLAPEARDQFKAFCLEHQYDTSKHVLPHGSYLVNLAQPDPEKADQAYNCFLDELQRCEALGIKLHNFHPGSTGGHPRNEAIGRIAAKLNKVHKATNTVITVLENMAGAGNVVGSTFEDLRDIIALIDDKSRVGVCLDTCHTFASGAGYDLRSPEAFKKTMDSFADIVGMPYLRALHLNDSKAPFKSNRDLHANIGTGFLGLRAFHNVVNFRPFQDLPMILETPITRKGPDGKPVEDKGVWAEEIKLLEGLIDADPDSDEFKKEEQRLQDLGAEDRKKFQGQADKKQQKTLDSMFKKASPKKKKKVTEEEDDDESDAGHEGCTH